MNSNFTIQKILKIFNSDINRNTLIKAELAGKIPKARRDATGAVKRRVWGIDDLPLIGEQYGFLKKPKNPICATVFVTKGGVLKTTLSLNIARIAALHNIKTCIVGLDMQADITRAFGIGDEDEDAESLEEAMESFTSNPGLYDFQKGSVELLDCLIQTDIPNLYIIPESSELVSLEASIQNQTRREDWLNDQVVSKLKQHFDLIVIDSPPNWNQLVSNALIASDVLISPIECKINHFRNIQSFQLFIEKFKVRAKTEFNHIFIPTKFVSVRKLSGEIRKWYMSNIKNCITTSIRESTLGEEATAATLSLLEMAPSKVPADEMREAISEIWMQFNSASTKKKNKKSIVKKKNNNVDFASKERKSTSSLPVF